MLANKVVTRRRKDKNRKDGESLGMLRLINSIFNGLVVVIPLCSFIVAKTKIDTCEKAQNYF